jgi:Transcription factor WhiB
MDRSSGIRSPSRSTAVCAGCAVRGPYLEAALRGPQARDDHSGIFAGTTARKRVALCGRAWMAEGTRFVHDQAAAERRWRWRTR